MPGPDLKILNPPPWSAAKAWLIDQALPLWSSAGFDPGRSNFHERLTLDGQPIADVPRRLMVQARQIYVYAMAARHGWMAGAPAIVAAAADAMIRTYHESDGQPGWVFSVDAQGKVADATRDLYAHAFVMFGLAAAYAATGDAKYLDCADRTIAFLKNAMTAGGGGYVTRVPQAEPILLQNPHMHLLESFLALHAADPSRGYVDGAKLIVTLFEKHFFQAHSQILVEYFDPHWQPVAGRRGQLFEPGHHCEWIWLLDRYQTVTGTPAPALREALARPVREWGMSNCGWLYNEVGDDGRVVNNGSRLWPHTEALKASLAAPGLLPPAETWLATLYEDYLKPAAPGGWIDQRDSDGLVLSRFMPASSFYHIVCAFSEYADRMVGPEGLEPTTKAL